MQLWQQLLKTVLCCFLLICVSCDGPEAVEPPATETPTPEPTLTEEPVPLQGAISLLYEEGGGQTLLVYPVHQTDFFTAPLLFWANAAYASAEVVLMWQPTTPQDEKVNPAGSLFYAADVPPTAVVQNWQEYILFDTFDLTTGPQTGPPDILVAEAISQAGPIQTVNNATRLTNSLSVSGIRDEIGQDELNQVKLFLVRQGNIYSVIATPARVDGPADEDQDCAELCNNCYWGLFCRLCQWRNGCTVE